MQTERQNYKFRFVELLLPFVVIANQCAHWCGNLKNPLRHSRFPRQFANWLGMTIGLCVVFNSSINWNLIAD